VFVKSDSVNSTKLAELVRINVPVRQMGVVVTKVKPISNNTVIVTTDNRQQAQAYADKINELKIDGVQTAEIERKFKPRLKLYNVAMRQDMSKLAGDIVRNLMPQTEEDEKSLIDRIEIKYERQRGAVFEYIIETDGDMRRRLMSCR